MRMLKEWQIPSGVKKAGKLTSARSIVISGHSNTAAIIGAGPQAARFPGAPS